MLVKGHKRQMHSPLFGYLACVFKSLLLIRINIAALMSPKHFCLSGSMGDPKHAQTLG